MIRAMASNTAASVPASSTRRPVAVVTETLDTRCAEWLGERCEVVWARLDADGAEDRVPLEEVLPEAEALIVRTYTRVDAALLAGAPKLRVVGRAGVGLDNVDLAACRARGVPVVYTPDANTQAVVEYVLGLMLDWARPRDTGAMREPIEAERFHQLRKTQVGRQLSDLTLGVLGLGRIGTKLGRVAATLGMKVLACDLLADTEAGRAELTRRAQCPGASPIELVDHDTLYRHGDIVSVHVDGRASNRGLIDASVTARLKPDVLLINAARGMLVDNAALADFARSNPDARLVLDVHDPEPPPAPPGYPLWGLDNVTLMPHLASRTDTALENMSWVVRDIAAVLADDPPRYPAW